MPPHYYNRLTREGQVLADTDLWIDTHFCKTCNPMLAAKVMALCNSEPAVRTAQNANRKCG